MLSDIFHLLISPEPEVRRPLLLTVVVLGILAIMMRRRLALVLARPFG